LCPDLCGERGSSAQRAVVTSCVRLAARGGMRRRATWGVACGSGKATRGGLGVPGGAVCDQTNRRAGGGDADAGGARDVTCRIRVLRAVRLS
jgi:hypothetical protein